MSFEGLGAQYPLGVLHSVEGKVVCKLVGFALGVVVGLPEVIAAGGLVELAEDPIDHLVKGITDGTGEAFEADGDVADTAGDFDGNLVFRGCGGLNQERVVTYDGATGDFHLEVVALRFAINSFPGAGVGAEVFS